MNRILCNPLGYVISAMLLLGIIPEVKALPRCLHVMSYHQGYEWNDGIENGVENSLKGKCQLRKFYMDSKRNTSPEFIRDMALQAKNLIENYQPDIVIASDDNASQYLVQPYYKDDKLPVIFTGINWTAETYNYPYKNTTGMVEVSPVATLFEVAQRNTDSIREIAFLSADVLTEHKDYAHYLRVYDRMNIKVRPIFVKNMREWEAGFVEAQTADFIILGNNAGVSNWDNKKAIHRVNQSGKTLTMTTYEWMMPYTMVGVGKVASEQGEWAAEVALEVLAGTPVFDIPITINRRWIFFRNNALLIKAGILIDDITRHKAVSKTW